MPELRHHESSKASKACFFLFFFTSQAIQESNTKTINVIVRLSVIYSNLSFITKPKVRDTVACNMKPEIAFTNIHTYV